MSPDIVLISSSDPVGWVPRLTYVGVVTVGLAALLDCQMPKTLLTYPTM